MHGRIYNNLQLYIECTKSGIFLKYTNIATIF